MGHVVDGDLGIMKTDIERVRIKNDAPLYLTLIIAGVNNTDDVMDDGRWYIDFEDV